MTLDHWSFSVQLVPPWPAMLKASPLVLLLLLSLREVSCRPRLSLKVELPAEALVWPKSVLPLECECYFGIDLGEKTACASVSEREPG